MPKRKISKIKFEQVECEPAPAMVENVFAAGGKLAGKFSGYTPRPGQVAMMRQVWHSINNRVHSAIEAPCGTGKSLAYLVPSAVWALSQLKSLTKEQLEDIPPTIVVVTAGITLQEQLVNKDIPLVVELLNASKILKYGILKGRSNYMCNAQLAIPDVADDSVPPRLKYQVTSIRERIRKPGSTGDKSELDFEPDHKVWARVSMSTDDCPRGLCEYRGSCYGFKAQEKAQECNIIVTNYHMLLTSVFNPDMGLLPMHENCIYILDEAHEMPDIARQVGGGIVTALQCIAFFNVAEDAELLSPGQTGTNIAGVHKLFTEMAKDYSAGILKVALPQLFYELVATVEATASKANDVIDDIVGTGEKKYLSDQQKTRLAFLQSTVKRANKIISLRNMTENTESEYVISLEEDGGKQYLAVKAQLVEPANLLHKMLFDQVTCCINTSATLTTGSGSFNYFSCEAGMPDGSLLDSLPSPFDFETQALLVTPIMATDNPNDALFKTDMCEKFVQAVALANGRTLGLFTSYDSMRKARDLLESYRMPYRILDQGSAPKDMLIKEFRENVNSVLLGTTSLWTGIDISGEALSLVFIDKLPFPQMNDPVICALQEKYDNWFEKFSLPGAIMALRQGFGRLIRSTSDKGVVVLCDPRLRTKGYGKSFVTSLPKCRSTSDMQEIQRFLGTKECVEYSRKVASLYAMNVQAGMLEEDEAVPF